MSETFSAIPSKYYEMVRRKMLEDQHEEYKYLHLMQDILDNGVEKSDRTGVGTKSIFGTHLKFDISKSIPVLTTKKVFWKGVVEELLWFIRGDTDSKNLEAKGVNIWKGNTTREFLDNKRLNYPEGEIGPGYGFQWRHWGASYPINGKQILSSQNSNQGIDQLQNVIDTIRTNPNDRRMIVSAWNVSEIDNMALPPCHMMYQFFVSDDKLHCQWYQRSVDSFLGWPFNVSSYALLTYLIAKVVGLGPGTVSFCGGDTHLYMNHIDQVKEQLRREPYPFPTLNVPDVKSLEDICDLSLADLPLINYQSHATIKAPMAV